MEWKSSKRFTSPFQPLSLSPEAASELEALAEVFVSESIRTYERFVLDENCEVDANRWKFMYKKDDVKSYAEPAGFSPPTPGMESCHRPRSLSSSTSELPIVLVTGTMQGALDDTIYGLVCPTLDMMRLKTSYVQDTMYRACVLASLVTPTAEDPFRSVSIKWVEKGQPLHSVPSERRARRLPTGALGAVPRDSSARLGYPRQHVDERRVPSAS
jgi:hypothetical protein